MEIDVATTTVVGGQVEDGVDAGNGLSWNCRVQEVGLYKLDGAGINVAADVGELAAAEVVHDADPRAGRDQRVHQVRADERRATGDQDRPAGKGLSYVLR